MLYNNFDSKNFLEIQSKCEKYVVFNQLQLKIRNGRILWREMMLSVTNHIDVKQKEERLYGLLGEKKLSALDFIMSIYPIKEDTQITSKNAELIFNQINKILNLSIEAIHKFQAGDLRAFDAHVGETSCQIRAYKTVNIFKLKRQTSSFSEEINKIIELKLQLKNIVHKRSVIFFGSLFATRCEKIFSEDVFYLCGCYFLNKFSDKDCYGFPENINLESIKNSLSTTLKLSKRLKNYFQKKIAEVSCAYVCQLAQNQKKSYNFQKTLMESISLDNNNREVIPLFSSIGVINDDILSGYNYVALVIALQDGEQISILFEFNGKSFKQVEALSNKLDLGCYVIFGIANVYMSEVSDYYPKFINYMKNMMLIEISISNHPQLVNGINAIIPSEYSKRFDEAKKSSKLLGCILGDSSFFRAIHIYADIIKHLNFKRH